MNVPHNSNAPSIRVSSAEPETMRYLVVILGLVVVLGSLGLVKFSQIRTMIGFGKEAAAAGPPPEAVASAVAQEQVWEEALSAIGSVASQRGVVLRNEAPGAVIRIHFESGETVKKGQVLLELDANVERAQLAAAKARRDLANVSERRARALFESGVSSRQEVDTTAAELETAGRELEALQAEIELKVVRAPFAGRLGIREVDLGQYLNAGSPITELETVGAVYVDFTLPQQHLGSVHAGMPVRLTRSDAAGSVIDGSIAAVEPVVDAKTRSFQVRATVPNEKETLSAGMFVDVAVVMPVKQRTIAVPATAIVHAPYGDSIFVIENKKPGSPGMVRTPAGKPVRVVRQQFVRLGGSRGDFVGVAEGLRAGQEVVSAGAFKLRNGAPVVVDNKGAPKPELNPRPENR